MEMRKGDREDGLWRGERVIDMRKGYEEQEWRGARVIHTRTYGEEEMIRCHNSPLGIESCVARRQEHAIFPAHQQLFFSTCSLFKGVKQGDQHVRQRCTKDVIFFSLFP